jgi:protein-S-isoprenylcysteine O-methyltransferase Ste14
LRSGRAGYWSAAVTKKEDHRLIDTGPYAIVRHPIHTRVIAALTATAIAEAHPLAPIGAVLFAVSFTVKARLEETLLRNEFGLAYAAYAARTPMLIPFWPRTG